LRSSLNLDGAFVEVVRHLTHERVNADTLEDDVAFVVIGANLQDTVVQEIIAAPLQSGVVA
jgi:hypothetical protein